MDRVEQKCPVDAESKAWIEGKMAWLVDTFGWKRLLEAPVVLPTDEFFPDPYNGSEEGAKRLLDRVAGYMHANPEDFELEVSFQGRPVRPGPSGEATAEHNEQEDRTKILVEISQLRDAILTTATLAYELGRELLVGRQRSSPEEDDCEPLTDLLTVFLGLGVFTANATFGSVGRHAGHFTNVRNTSGPGGLTAAMFGYALALFAWLRKETDPVWSQSLRPDVNRPFREGLLYLSKTGDSTIVREKEWNPDKSCDCSNSASPMCGLSIAGASCEDKHEPDELSGHEELKSETADDYFTRGTIHANNGNMEHALADFSDAIRLEPDDPECYQQRALVYVRMNRPDEALADAEAAVRLDTDEVDFYHARGITYVGVGQYEAAIDDLDYFISEEQGARGVETHLIEAFFFRGLAYAGSGQWHRAIADYTRAINRTPRFAEAFAARGLAYEKLNKTAKAEADRQEALRLNSKLADEK